MIFFLASVSQNANNQGIYDIFAPHAYHKKAEIKPFMIFLKSDAVRTISFPGARKFALQKYAKSQNVGLLAYFS